ncbi:MAG: hypothetical protein A2X37_05110 [Elusimicrobia bacterium GWA2_66_18]|nr:MAG: hypothetical protein A2X37_05110 [Elusimicrobia bacterium GWA2_66_18]
MIAPVAPKDDILRLPFLNGVYVAVDAISDSYLIVDGPYCVFTKAEMQYCHNLRCRLLPPIGYRRVVHTGQIQREEVQSLSADRSGLVERIFADVCAQPDAGIVLSTAFDFHELVGFPLKEISRRHAGATSALVCHVPSRSLGGTWLDGYALTCAALAEAVTLRPGRGRQDAVAIVGHLQDRDEPDAAGNLRELKRLLGAIGLRVTSVWLSGGGRAELEAAERAGLVVSMPYAREAARIVARRLGVSLCEVDLPLGLSATEDFLLKIAARVGRRARAKAFIKAESAAAVRDTEAHVLRLLAGRGVLILQEDSQMEARLRELSVDLGLRDLSASGAQSASGSERVLCLAPTARFFQSDLLHVPMGYPNYLEHPVYERPFLGYAGLRHLVDRLCAAVLHGEAAGAGR